VKNIKDKIQYLKDYWETDYELEIEDGNKILIFDFDGGSYWDHNDPEVGHKWHFNGIRIVSEPDLEEHPQYKEFIQELIDDNILGSKFTLEEAIELIENYF